MKAQRWLITSALLFSAHSFAGIPEQPMVQDSDVEDTISALRKQCEIYEQHDQIYPFKIKVNFRGRFVRMMKKPYCATFENMGAYTRKLSMKYNRFSCPDDHGPLSWTSQVQVVCHQYFAQKFESLNKGPLLSFELTSCSDINADSIRQQTIDQLNGLIKSESSPYMIGSDEQLVYDSCTNLQSVATSMEPGLCQQEDQYIQQQDMQDYEDQGIQGQGVQDQGVQDQGVQDQGVQDQGVQDQGVQDQGVQDQGVQDQGVQGETEEQGVEGFQGMQGVQKPQYGKVPQGGKYK